MTAAHTPGEWRFIFRGVDQEANWASRIPYAIERAVGNAVLPIADVCDQPQAEANARLLAAAPELLRALSCFVAMVHKDQILTTDRHRAALIAALTSANYAIAKATGAA